MSINDFTWVENTSQFNEDFIINNSEGSNEEYFFEVDFEYPQKLHDLLNDLSFLLERMKIEIVEKPLVKLNGKKEYVIHIRNLK